MPLQSAEEIIGYTLEAKDGEFGRCSDFLFDDRHRTIRYLVASTFKWLPGRKVLVSPIFFDKPDFRRGSFKVYLTKEEIRKSPPLENDAPVSRQYERRWYAYHGWIPYWQGREIWGPVPYPSRLAADPPEAQLKEDIPPVTTHVRSVKEVTGYHIQALDDDIGHVEDFLFDDANWMLRYIIVDTRNWLPGKKVLVSSRWITRIDWTEETVSVDLKKADVKNSPEYDRIKPVDRAYEARLHEHYGKSVYW